MTSRDHDSQRPDSGPASTSARSEKEPASSEVQIGHDPSTLAATAAGLRTDEQRLSLRARELNEQGRTLDQRDALTSKREREVAVAEGALEARARVITQRELEADAGFTRKSREAMAELEARHAALRARVHEIEQTIDTERVQRLTQLDNLLATERATRLDTLDAELADARRRAAQDARSALEREQARIARDQLDHEARTSADRAQLEAEQVSFRASLDQERAALGDREAELHREQGKVQWRADTLAGRATEIERLADERASDHVSSLERQLAGLREDHVRLQERRATLERQSEAHREFLARFNGAPEKVLLELDEARATIAERDRELLSRPSAADKERLVEMNELQRTWSEERSRLVQELSRLHATENQWHVSVDELEAQRDQCEIARRRRDVLLAEMKSYDAEVKRLKGLYESPEQRAGYIKSIETPILFDFERAPEDRALTELAWLARIVDACEASGMRFSRRLVLAFHTSLKAAEMSPLTVLAGVSGTGKSELPRLYARFGGLAFLAVPVQPSWDGPESLFGFFNSIDDRFKARKALQAMVQAQMAPNDDHYRHGLSDRLLLILLDEMNLAHVEQYFSDLLSLLEQRRGESRDVTLDIDLGAREAPYPVKLGRNVMWVGTMNEDETTKALSDKVIDRSNLLYFPRPKTLHSRKDVRLAAEAPLLPEWTWRSWIQTQSPFTTAEVDPFRLVLEAINGHLEQVGRALGHRVWQAVEYYMANHPEVIDARARKDHEAAKKAMRRAYEDQLVLKVMPKLRGIETTGEARRSCLDPIRKQLEDPDLKLELTKDFDVACRVGNGVFVWNSARYLESAE